MIGSAQRFHIVVMSRREIEGIRHPVLIMSTAIRLDSASEPALPLLLYMVLQNTEDAAPIMGLLSDVRVPLRDKYAKRPDGTRSETEVVEKAIEQSKAEYWGDIPLTTQVRRRY